jgi:antitoxin VapB
VFALDSDHREDPFYGGGDNLAGSLRNGLDGGGYPLGDNESSTSPPILLSRSLQSILYFYLMALSIKSDEADRLARQLASETGETLTEAVVTALQERLDREHARHSATIRRRLARLSAHVATLPVADDRRPDEIIDYDDAGLPR